MCDAVHAHGTLAGVELWHCAQEAGNLDSRVAPMGVGALPSDVALQSYAHQADEDEIRQLINLYGEAGKRARDAGFDIIYAYGSHRALPMQFLSPRFNHRSDGYGGSFENRARFWIETMAALKKAAGDECALAVRISIDQLLGSHGVETFEDGLRFVEYAESEGMVDLWDVNITQYMEWGEDAAPSRFQKANHQAPWSRHVKSVAKKPVLGVGRVTSPDDMVAILASGQADIIGAARPSIADPFLPRKIEEGRLEDIRECIGCNVCISRWERGAALVCSQNATANEEFRRGWHPEKFTPAQDPGGVLIVGAGPAGLECARVLGMRGYEVHLCEAEHEVGGHMLDVMRYPGYSEWGRVISYRQTQLQKLANVEIHTSARLSANDVLRYGAERVVLAAGAHWAEDGFNVVGMAPLPGADANLPQICTPEQVMAGKHVGERVVVLDADGYFTGVGMAEMMVDLGKQVSILSQYDSIAPMSEFTLEKSNLHRMMHEKGIRQYTNHWAEAIEPGNITKIAAHSIWRDGYQRSAGPKSGEIPRRAGDEVTWLECDTVILVTARVPNNALYGGLKSRREEWRDEGIEAVFQIGDCYAPRMLADVIFDGHRLAREFESDNPARPLPFIRERFIQGQPLPPVNA
jgi:dimethylamine/trimethylamine dehydrogenase